MLVEAKIFLTIVCRWLVVMLSEMSFPLVEVIFPLSKYCKSIPICSSDRQNINRLFINIYLVDSAVNLPDCKSEITDSKSLEL